LNHTGESSGRNSIFTESKETGRVQQVNTQQAQQVERQVISQRTKQEELKRRVENIKRSAELQGRDINESDIRAIYGGVRGQVEATKWKQEQISQIQTQLNPFFPGGVSKGFAKKYIELQPEIFKIQQKEFAEATGLPNASAEFISKYIELQPEIQERMQKEAIQSAIVGKENFRNLNVVEQQYSKKMT